MIDEAQIIEKLKKVDQYKFGRLIDSLLYNGAFPGVVPKYSVIEPYGTNIDKERTIRSSPRADTEVQAVDAKVESSVRADWEKKFKEEVEKHKGKGYEKFVFCTNQDTGTKQIDEGGTSRNADEYGKEQVQSQECVLIGMKELIGPLQNPENFYIRRACLGIEDDFFCAPSRYLEMIRNSPSFSSTLPEAEMDSIAKEVGSVVPFSSRTIYVLHNNEYSSLLHAVGVWAEKEMAGGPLVLERDHSFNRWFEKNRSLLGFDAELSKEAETYVLIWGAHEIENISDYLIFHKQNTALVFICKSGYEDEVAKRLQSSGGNIDPRIVSLLSIDKREITVDEVSNHEQKISAFVKETSELVLRLEALVYYFSPLRADDQGAQAKMASVLKIDVERLLALRRLMIDGDLAAVTGEIVWLKQPGIARTLLDRFIGDGTFDLADLV